MNVEMINTLDQIKSTLSMAKSIADRRLRDPCSNPVDVSNFLLMRIDVVLQDIDETIRAEEDALEAYYQEYVQHEANGGKGLEKRFNPLIHSCADEISSAFCDCWVAVRAESNNGRFPEYTISIQPSGYTPNDIQLKLKSLGYASTFKEVKELEHSTWAYFQVYKNGIAFQLSSTVSSIEPPELERFDEPATDAELPF